MDDEGDGSMAYSLSRKEVDMMMQRCQQKESVQAISEPRAGTGRRSPRWWPIRPTSTPQPGVLVPSKLDPYTEYIAERWAQGCQNAQVLWEEVRSRGFTGSLSLVKQHVARYLDSSIFPPL